MRPIYLEPGGLWVGVQKFLGHWYIQLVPGLAIVVGPSRDIFNPDAPKLGDPRTPEHWDLVRDAIKARDK